MSKRKRFAFFEEQKNGGLRDARPPIIDPLFSVRNKYIKLNRSIARYFHILTMSLLLYSLLRAVNIHISESHEKILKRLYLSGIVKMCSRFFGSLVLPFLVFQLFIGNLFK